MTDENGVEIDIDFVTRCMFCGHSRGFHQWENYREGIEYSSLDTGKCCLCMCVEFVP